MDENKLNALAEFAEVSLGITAYSGDINITVNGAGLFKQIIQTVIVDASGFEVCCNVGAGEQL